MGGGDTELCFVVIRLAPNAQSTILSLVEVELYDAQGQQIPRSTLRARMSSSGSGDVATGTPLVASNCINGDVLSRFPNVCQSGKSYGTST